MIWKAKIILKTSHSKICFKKLITLLVLVLVYFHLLSRSYYVASQQKLYKLYQHSMAKYPELYMSGKLPSFHGTELL